MAYNWGGVLKAPLPIDGQVWVDADKHVWRYDIAAQSWNRAPYLELRPVYSRRYPVMGLSTSDPILGNPRKSGRLDKVWDEVYDLAFVEATSTEGTVRGRRAAMTSAEVNAWLPTVMQTAGTAYNEQVILTVYEVFDTQANLPKWTVWNGLYSSYRGRDCYTGAQGQGRPGLPHTAGYAPNFVVHHSVLLEQLFVQHFYYQVTALQEPRCCWNPRSKAGMYHHPNNNTARIVEGATGRWCWNSTTQVFQAVNAGSVWLHDGIAMLSRTPGGTSVSIDEMPYATRGLRPILGNKNSGVYDCRESVVVRAVFDQDNPHLKAFVVKPYGVTQAAFDTGEMGGRSLFAVGSYEAAGKDAAVVPVAFMNRGPGGVRFGLTEVYSALATSKGGQPFNHTIDTPMIPEVVRFYIRDNLTGVRTPLSEQHLYTSRRRSAVPLAVMFRHS